jgi:hypothetical protein
MSRTEEQIARLNELWSVYGYEGPKYTIGNHKLLQKLIKDPSASFDDALALYSGMFGGGSGGGPAKDITDDCLAEIRAILGS